MVRESQRERSPRWRTALVVLAAILVVWWLTRPRGDAPADSGPPLAKSEEEVATMDEESPEPPEERAPAQQLEDSGGGAAEPLVLSGSLLDASDREPAEDFTIRVSNASGDVAESTSDVTGSFTMRWTGTPPEIVEVPARAGWTDGLAPRSLTATEADGSEPILLLVPLRPTAAVRGLVFDRGSGSPLSALLVRVTSGEDTLEARTDERGMFATDSGLPTGTVRLAVIDEAPEGPLELTVVHVEHDGESAADVPVQVGPTICVRPGGVAASGSSFRARIVEHSGDPSLAGRLLRSPWGWSLAGNLEAERVEPWSWVRLRAGQPPWIRYGSVEREPTAELAPVLELVSDDGRLEGSAPLATTVGVLESPVDVELRPVGTLVGSVEVPDGVSSTAVRLWVEESDTRRSNGPWSPAVDGTFRIAGVRPGALRLVVSAPERSDLVRDVTVVPGENALGELGALPPASTFQLSGTLECTAGHRVGAALVELEDESGKERRRQLLQGVRPGRVAELSSTDANRFAFFDLRSRRYSVRVLPITGLHEWTPAQVSASLPAPRLEFRCSAGRPPVDVDVRAVDAETGEPVRDQELHLGPVRLPPFTWPESRPVERWYSVPADSPLGWTLSAPGYRPAQGAVGDLTEGAPRRVARVELERGFGMRLELVAASEAGGSAIAGVEAVVGGRVVGTSDAHGTLVLALEAPPDRIDLRHPRWTAYAVEAIGPSESRLPHLRVRFRAR